MKIAWSARRCAKKKKIQGNLVEKTVLFLNLYRFQGSQET